MKAWWMGVAFALMPLALVSPAVAEVRAIVVGINEYAEAQELRGAVNDARLIAEALGEAGVGEVALLLDEAATATEFDRVWGEVLGRSMPGDIVIFSFSGHGIRVPEQVARTTPDGFQKGFLLQPYDEENAPDEILKDEALYDRFAAATASGVKIVFVADACYAGAATRGIDARGAVGLTRFQRFSTNAGPLSGVATNEVVARPLNPDVSVFSATIEQRSIQEIVVGETYHGALSYAFAEGIGRAGSEGVSDITLGMLKDYVSPQVMLLSNKRQIPQFIVPEPELELFRKSADNSRHLDQLPPVSLSIIDGPAALTEEFDGAILSAAGSAAELTFQTESGTLVDSNGDVLAVGLSAQELPAALATRRVVKALQRDIAGEPARVGAVVSSVDNPRGDQFFTEGTIAQFTVDAADYPYAAVIDLTGAGDVQLIWPLAALGDPEDGSVAGTIEVRAPVTTPFGADYIITVLSRTPLLAFNRELAAHHNTGAPSTLYALLEAARVDGAVLGIDVLFSCRELGSAGECILSGD